MKKELVFIVLVMNVLLISSLVSSLGLTPAKIEMDFVPNFEKTFDFEVSTNKPDQALEVYAEGELSKYVSFSKKKFTGSSEFSATLDLPSDMKEPGKHKVIIGVKEVIPEKKKEVKTSIGTRVKVQSITRVFVPYPGKYLHVDLNAKNVNVGEPVDFVLKIDNKGKQDVKMNPRVEVYSGSEKVDKLNFFERDLPSKESITLHKKLNTTGYSPGEYNANAIVDYGGKKGNDTDEFMLGHLFIEISNYTDSLQVGGIEKFNMEVENKWNGKIEGVYADVSILNETSDEIMGFRTSPTSLDSWEKKNLTGFVDTSKIGQGTYDFNATLHYSGEISSKILEVEFSKGNKGNVPLIAIGVVVVLVGIGSFLFWRKKHKNEKKR